MAKKIAIVGAGASGLLCAIVCAQHQCHVDIFEQNAKCAKKILVSGNGRCNIANINPSSNDYFGENPLFVQDALAAFSYKKFENFCHSIGLILDKKDNGKVYPLSNEAKSVAFILENHARTLGVHFHTENKITDVDQLFFTHDVVVVATGSQAANHLGSNNDGHNFAKLYGHNIIPTYPSLVQLELKGNIHAKMNGDKIFSEVSLYIDNVLSNTIKGDVLFTNYGVSGFAILDISQQASKAIMLHQDVKLSLNLLPSLSTQQLASHLHNQSKSAQKSIFHILHGLLPLKTANAIIDMLHLHNENDINMKVAKKIANQISKLSLNVQDTHGFRHAEVSGGGIDTRQINPKTMESFLKPNLYFCGEVLDVVGKRGGFNFSWAWASAYSCAQDIIRKI